MIYYYQFKNELSVLRQHGDWHIDADSDEEAVATIHKIANGQLRELETIYTEIDTPDGTVTNVLLEAQQEV